MKNQPRPSADMNSSNKKIGVQRAFEPLILQTKEELLVAMKQGKLKTSKYNLLNETEKLFVELVCFGGYTGEQAVKVISPGTKSCLAVANRIMANPAVVDTMNELTIAKDKKFAAEVSSAKEMALAKLQFIMATTEDQSLAASCAKTILDKAEAYSKASERKEDEGIGQVKFNIQVENVYTGKGGPATDEPVIIELSPDEIKGSTVVDVKVDEKGKEIPEDRPVNPETGMPYTLHYEGVDNYTDSGEDEPESEEEK